MKASSRLVVGLDGRGWSSPTTLHAEAPLLLRVTDQDCRGLTIHLVGGAAGPLGGDCLDLAVSIGAMTHVTVRSVAASLAQPGRESTSVSTIDANIAAGAVLDWWPQPLLSVAGSDHVVHTRIDLDEHASVRWVDEIVLGRASEPGGRLTIDQRVTVCGVPILCHQAIFDPRHTGAGRHGTARAIVTALVVGPEASDSSSIVTPAIKAARFAITPWATTWIGLGDDIDEVRETVIEALGLGGAQPARQLPISQLPISELPISQG